MFYGKAVTILSPLLKIIFAYAEKSQYYLSYCCSPLPHTRGIVVPVRIHANFNRITPAYVGKSNIYNRYVTTKGTKKP